MSRPYLLQEEVLVGLHAHGVLVFAAHLVKEPVQRVVVALGVLHQAVPQDVHLLQTQSWGTRETLLHELPAASAFGFSEDLNQVRRSRILRAVLTEVVRRSERREDTGEELQTDLDLSAVAVPARSHNEEEDEDEEDEEDEERVSVPTQAHNPNLRFDQLTVQTCAGVPELPGCSAAGCQRTASSCAVPSRPT